MLYYKSPVDDYQFLLHELLRVHSRSDVPGFKELSPEFTLEILAAAAKFHEGVLHPLNAAGDLEGAHMEGGQVRTPAGFRRAWAMYQETGWHRMTLPGSIGGEDLPPLLGVAIDEMGIATGHSFKMYGAFCAPAAYMLSELGEPWMREHVVPRLVSGEWTATMCMTESHCGTDLRQLRTRAIPAEDGSWRISGTKIFISGGDHDLTDNIVHIVLAKVPDANGRFPDDLSSVNVFLVSKWDLDPATGRLGGGHGVSVVSIEHKMGIEGNATCVMNFDNVQAWRIAGASREGSGANMAAMFLLMKYARLATAISGIAYADLSYQNAAAYARERLSGRAANGPRNPGEVADPIVVHPDVRRLLLESRAFAEGARATVLKVAMLQSIADSFPDKDERVRALDVVEIMIPVMKAYFTDKGFEAANACLQIFGGHGYIRDSGMEQLVRNARIGQIYEGANGIQAHDLLVRKLKADKGRGFSSFRACVEESIERCTHCDRLSPMALQLRAGLNLLASAHELIAKRAVIDPHAPGAASYDLLTMYGTLALGWTWLELAEIQCRKDLDASLAALARCKGILAKVWMERQMPLLEALYARIATGSLALMELADADV